MEIDFDMGSLLGSASGGGLVVVLAKLYLQRAFTELDQVVKTMHRVKEDLAAITVKLESIEKNDEIIRIHDRKIAKIEARLNNNVTKINSN